MKKKPNKKLTNVLTALGAVLVLSAVLLLMVSVLGAGKNGENARRIAGELTAVMPPIQSGFPEDRVNKSMPMYIVDGEGFIGTVEIPVYHTFLPVCGSWSKTKVNQYPCRYTGTVYGDCLVLGGSDSEGQFDFMKLITKGDLVSFTDMTGMRYTYAVEDIERTKDVSAENLSVGEYTLVLFAKNTYSLDYTVVRCVLKGANAH